MANIANIAKIDLTGQTAVFEKALSAADVAQFADISGDDHPLHVDDAYARNAGLPGRIVQGSLLVGLMAGASTKYFRDIGVPALSYGYDKIRYTGTVNLGQHLSVTYTVIKHDLDSGKTWADIAIRDETGRMVAVATHVAKLL